MAVPLAGPDGACALLRIHALTQLLAGLEVRNELLRHLDLFARLGVSAHARRAVVEPETAEAADLDALALDEAVGHGIKNSLDRELGILRNQMRIAPRQPGDQFGL